MQSHPMTERSRFFQKARVVPDDGVSSFTIPSVDPLVVMTVVAIVLGAIIGCAIIWRRNKSIRDWIVVDGSNVLYWDNQVPSIKTVRNVLNRLIEVGFSPIVWFDANVGHVVGTRYFNAHDLARHLPVSADQIFVSDRGVPADPSVIAKAKQLGVRVVTNDRFRDWAKAHPEVQNQTFFVRGKVTHGRADFEFEKEVQAEVSP